MRKKLGKRIPIDTKPDQIKIAERNSQALPIPLRRKAANHMLHEPGIPIAYWFYLILKCTKL